MNFGVYEHTIDYGAMFDYLFTLKDGASQQDYIYDTINNSNIFYQNHKPARRIYLWEGQNRGYHRHHRRRISRLFR